MSSQTKARTDRKALLINAAAGAMGFLVNAGVVLVMTPLLIAGLGDDGYGAWALVLSLSSYLMLVELDIPEAVLRFVARYRQTNDDARLVQIFSTSVALLAVGGVVVLALAALLALPFARPLGVPAELADPVRWTVLIFGVGLALHMPTRAYTGALEGIGRYPSLTLVIGVCTVIYGVVVIVAVGRGAGLPTLGLIAMATTAVQSTALVFLARRNLGQLRLSSGAVDRGALATVRKFAAALFVATVAERIILHSQAFVINGFLGPEAITYYVIGANVVEYARRGMGALTATVTSAVSALHASGDLESIRRLCLDFTRYLLLVVLPAQIGFFLLGDRFIAIWVDPRYVPLSYPTLVVLAAPLGLLGMRIVARRVLVGLGRLRVLAVSLAIEATVILTLALVLAGPTGIVGVAWGSAIPCLLQCLLLLSYLCRELELSAWRYLGAAVLRPVLLATLPLAIWLVAEPIVQPAGWLGFIGVVFAGVLPYAALALWLELRDRARGQGVV